MPSRSATGTFGMMEVITVPTWAVSQDQLPMRISVDSRFHLRLQNPLLGTIGPLSEQSVTSNRGTKHESRFWSLSFAEE